MTQESALPTSSYVILGLIAQCGPSTSYQLKKQVDESVGYFWDFPRAQLYLDPERLVGLGLLREEREEGGRHRRYYHLTERGREVIRSWVREKTTASVELRDMGLLKLFFSNLGDAEQLQTLAREQIAMHHQRLRKYESLVEHMPAGETAPFGLATLRMGRRYEEASIAFWEEIAMQPPEVASGGHAPSSPQRDQAE